MAKLFNLDFAGHYNVIREPAPVDCVEGEEEYDAWVNRYNTRIDEAKLASDLRKKAQERERRLQKKYEEEVLAAKQARAAARQEKSAKAKGKAKSKAFEDGSQ